MIECVMENRILFVDDEPLMREVYAGLGPTMGAGYEVLTSASAASALNELEKQAVDVVVSDLQMPDMNGADFLANVERKFPDAMRVVISGYTDQLAVARCLMFGHRYYQKPIAVTSLADSLKRVCELKRVIRSEKLQKIIGATTSLPSPPETYLRLTEAIDSPDTSIDDLARIVQVDPGLTAKLLQIVNSPQFGVAYQVSSAAEAMQIVGIEVLRALMLGLHALKFWEKKKCKSLPLPQLWQHLLETAVAAKKLARAEELPGKMAEECFVAGLLHDIGKMVLAAHADQQYGELLKRAAAEKMPATALERDYFGATHADIGAYLLGLWGVPEEIVKAVELHHSLGELPDGGFFPVIAVHAAQHLSDSPARAEGLDRENLERLGYGGRLEGWAGALKE